MSEIKGQLLGIVLVLIVFASVSLAVSGIFTNTVEKVTEKTEATIDAAGEAEDDNELGNNPMRPFLSYYQD